LYACLAKKENNKNNKSQSSKNKFNTLSFALRLRPGRYHVREEFLAFNGTVAVQKAAAGTVTPGAHYTALTELS
jgi:hypothetical protein